MNISLAPKHIQSRLLKEERQRILSIGGCECKRCTHVWLAIREPKPLVCPKCKSAYWETPADKNHSKRILQGLSIHKMLKKYDMKPVPIKQSTILPCGKTRRDCVNCKDMFSSKCEGKPFNLPIDRYMSFVL